MAVACLAACGGTPRSAKPPPDNGAESSTDVCAERTEGNPSWIVVTSEQRYTPDVKRFSEVTSSLERPVEACQARGQAEYLMNLRCDDGSAPFATVREAARARTGNAGSGGRCDNVIDHYQVACPEGTYAIFMDLYMCLRAEVPEPIPETVVVDRGVTVIVPNGWMYASGHEAGVDYRMNGPDGVSVVGAVLSNADPPAVGELRPAFAELGASPPSRIDERRQVGEGAEVWLFPQQEFTGVAIALLTGGHRRIVLATGPADALPQHTDEIVDILSQTASNDHAYADLGSFLRAGTPDLNIELRTIEGRNVGLPGGWKAVVRSSDVSAQFADERGRLSFGRSDFDGNPGDTVRSLCDAELGEWTSSFRSVTILHAGYNEGETSYISLRDVDGERIVFGVRKNDDGSFTRLFLVGTRELFDAEGALALFVALSAI